MYWTNFNLPNKLSNRESPPITANKARKKNRTELMCNYHEINLDNYKGKQSKEKIANNLVDYEAGKTILQTALGIVERENVEQLYMFP